MTTTDQQTGQVARPEPKVPVDLIGPQNDLDATFRLAKALSMSSLLPEALRSRPNDVLVTMLYGQELGLAPMQAIQVIDVVKGRPFLRANLWVALARRAGHKVRVLEQTRERCTVEVIRHDDPDGPMRVTYTIDDAKTAGLTSNSNYTKNPKAMLYARAASTAIRQACPEVALGFGDEAEHALSVQSERADRPSLGEVAAARAERPVSPAPAEVVDDSAVQAEVLAIAAAHTGDLPVEDPPELPVEWPPVAQPGGGA
jgi:hypothetical protein